MSINIEIVPRPIQEPRRFTREEMLATPGVYLRDVDGQSATRFISFGEKVVVIQGSDGRIIKDESFFTGPFKKMYEVATLVVQ